MGNFINSFQPLIKKFKLKRYLLEIILLMIATLITVISFLIYVKNSQNNEEKIITPEIVQNLSTHQVKIFVDISGAVNKPDLYEMNSGVRIKEVVDKAGGLSDDADLFFFRRNFNLARIVNDQEKIYIPSTFEVNNGTFIQIQRTLDYFLPNNSNANIVTSDESQTNNQLINLNSATIEELDQLPGIGKVTANKIITNRPFITIEDLLTKKLVNKSVYEKIKDLVLIN